MSHDTQALIEAKPPLCVDLFCGLGGWTDGFLAEGWNVVGFDVTRHVYGDDHYPAQLVLQDVLTIHGSQFRNADIIVASPPCQQYSWLAMPWSRSKCPECKGAGKCHKIFCGAVEYDKTCTKCAGTGDNGNSKAAKALRAKWEAEGPDNRLFDACFRIQREAIYARRLELKCCQLDYQQRGCPRCHIPLIVENVRGAQEWVGRAPWNYGSFYLWGDVPALMPKRMPGDFNKIPPAVNDAIRNGKSPARWTNPAEHYFGGIEGTKVGGDWFSDPACHSAHGSKSSARKAASAMIAKIPLPLSTHIARVYWPQAMERAA